MMSGFAKAASAYWFLALLALALLTMDMASNAAVAEDQCSGTLCDIFAKPSKPGAPSTAPAKPEAGTPLTVPTLAMPTPGGLLNFFKSSPAEAPAGTTAQQGAAAPLVRIEGGRNEERCSGTVCDFYYGTLGSKSSSEQQAAATPVSATSAGGGQNVANIREIAERQAKPRCVAPASDPWRCHR